MQDSDIGDPSIHAAKASLDLERLQESFAQRDAPGSYGTDIERIREELEFIVRDFKRRERTLEAVANE